MAELLKLEGLETQFRTHEGTVHAVNGVSISLNEGETLGIVGESGCGKSVSMMSMLRLIPTPPGKIVAGKALYQGNPPPHRTARNTHPPLRIRRL